MPKIWGIPGKMQKLLSRAEQEAKLPKVPLNRNPTDAWDYKKSRYRRIDLMPRAEAVQQGGVVPQATSGPVPSPTVTPTTSLTPTVTITPSATQSCVEYGTVNGYIGNIIQYNNQLYMAGPFTEFSGVSTSRFVRLSLNGDVDTTFSSNMGTGFSGGNPTYFGFQSNGKIVCGGNFTGFNGNVTSRIVRLNSDGSYDNTFNMGTGFGGGPVLALQVLSNDKILVGGQITSYNGTGINYICRLNSDGTLDNTFNALPDNSVQALVVQSDNKIIIGGAFTDIDGNTANYLGRLNADGSYDNTFDTTSGFNNAVAELALQPDGKVVCGGASFTNYSGVTANRIIRLNSDGTIDTSFNSGAGFNAQVLDVHLQSDGKILAAGQFTTYSGISSYKIIRLNSDGSFDNTFSNGLTFANPAFFINQLPGGRIAFGGGEITSYAGSIISNWAILNENGGLIDCTITPISPTPTTTPTLTPTPSVTSTLTQTPTESVTPTLTPTITETETPTPTPTPTVTPAVIGDIYQFEECGNPSNVFRYDNVPVVLVTGTTYEITSSNTYHILQEDGDALLAENGDFLDQENSNFLGFAIVVENTNSGPLYSSVGTTFTESVCPTPTPTITPTMTLTPTVTLTPSLTPTLTPTPSSTPIPIFPDWETNDLSSNDFMTAFDYYKDSFTIVSSASTTFGSYTAPLWYGGVAAPNGRIIGIPYRTTTALAIETSADTATTFGSFSGDFKWAGGVLAPNGFVYGVPFNSTSIIKIDPVNLSASTFGNLTGNTKWFGGCLGSNGKIYCAPYDSNQILEIDPTNDSTRLFGSISATTGGVARYSGGVLAPNNKIYFIPRRNESVLELDTSNDNTVFFGSLSGDYRYSSGALAYDGKIYCAPNDSSNVMIIDPDTQGLSFIGSFTGTNLYTEAVNGPDGNIYGIPLKATSMLKIDVSAQTTSNVGSYSSSIFNFGGGALGVNGCLYFIPLENTAIHRIGNTGQTLDENFVLSRYINKL